MVATGVNFGRPIRKTPRKQKPNRTAQDRGRVRDLSRSRSGGGSGCILLSPLSFSFPHKQASFPLPHLLKHIPRRSDQHHHHQNSMNEWSTFHARIIYHHFRNINTGRIPLVDLLHTYPYTLVESYCDV